MKLAFAAMLCLSFAASALAQQGPPPPDHRPPFGPGPGGPGPGPGGPPHHFQPHPFQPFQPHPPFGPPPGFRPDMECEAQYTNLQNSYNQLNAEYQNLNNSYSSLQTVNSQNAADLQACDAQLSEVPAAESLGLNICTLSSADGSGSLSGVGASATSSDPTAQATAVTRARQAAEADCAETHDNNPGCSDGAISVINCSTH